MIAAVKEMAAGYRDTWKAILWERILAEEPLTLEELGARFGRTRERMRQIDVLVRRDLAALRPRFEDAPEEEEEQAA
jgi:RNA polymerase sigma-32 factor